MVALAAVAALAATGSIGVVTGGMDLSRDAADHGSSADEARDHGVSSAEELAELPPPAEELDRVRTVTTGWGGDAPSGLPGAARIYGMELAADAEVVDSTGEVLEGLRDGRVVVGVVRTLAISEQEDGLVALDDDLGVADLARPVVVGDPRLVAGVDPLLQGVTADQLRTWWRRAAELDDLATVARAAVAAVPESERPAAHLEFDPEEDGHPVQLSAPDHDVEHLLIAIVAEALEQAGWTVEVSVGDGPSTDELVDGEVQLAVLSLDVAVEALTETDPAGVSSASAREMLAEAVAPAAVGDPAALPFGASYLVTEDVAARFGLARLSDLIPAAVPVEPVDPEGG